MQITRLRYTLPRRRRGYPPLMPADSLSCALPSLCRRVRLRRSIWKLANGSIMGQWNARGAGDARETVGGEEGSGCANWKTRSGHGVTVGILVTRLPIVYRGYVRPAMSFRFPRCEKAGFSAMSLSFDSERSDKSTSEIPYFAMTRGA